MIFAPFSPQFPPQVRLLYYELRLNSISQITICSLCLFTTNVFSTLPGTRVRVQRKILSDTIVRTYSYGSIYHYYCTYSLVQRTNGWYSLQFCFLATAKDFLLVTLRLPPHAHVGTTTAKVVIGKFPSETFNILMNNFYEAFYLNDINYMI